jgi:hypothetical protein
MQTARQTRRLGEQWSPAPVVHAPITEECRMSAFVNALMSLLALYGFGPRGAHRRRPEPISIGRPGGRRLA